MEKRKVSKLSKPIHAFERIEGWKTVDSPGLEIEIFRAMVHPIRRSILELLDEGPIRQADLTKLIKRETGRRYDTATLIHHLELLERAGLIGHRDLSRGGAKVKIIYRAKDVRLQVYERPEIEIGLEDTEGRS
jgi:DNA-binding transcriptional ArsR family regulator